MFVKICGITNEDDALLAVAMGADAVGFVFAPSSRQIPPVRAADIAKRLPSHILTVGVFRNEAPERVVSIVNRSGIGAAQLHGHETPAETEFVRDRVPRVMKAFVAGSKAMVNANEWNTDPILIDAPNPGAGKLFDWSLAQGAPAGLSVVMAGGLNPENVADAIAEVRPWGVDVASGVERAPGKKDPIAVREFVNNARAAGQLITDSLPDGDIDEMNAPYNWRVDG